MSALNSIATLRAQQGMTRAQLAKASRVPADKLAQYENGTALPPDFHALRLALALKVDFAKLATPHAPRAAIPAYAPPPISDDPIQAEIDDLTADRLSIECKDRWSMADSEEFSRINAALNAAYGRKAARDAADVRVVPIEPGSGDAA